MPSLIDLGQSWLGLAVASAYAYFGLNREESPPVETAAATQAAAGQRRASR